MTHHGQNRTLAWMATWPCRDTRNKITALVQLKQQLDDPGIVAEIAHVVSMDLNLRNLFKDPQEVAAVLVSVPSPQASKLQHAVMNLANMSALQQSTVALNMFGWNQSSSEQLVLIQHCRTARDHRRRYDRFCDASVTCSGHGACTLTGGCVCDDGWSGVRCTESTCIEDCLNRGACIAGQCDCFTGWGGYECSQLVDVVINNITSRDSAPPVSPSLPSRPPGSPPAQRY
jgi:hypothetical protein